MRKKQRFKVFSETHYGYLEITMNEWLDKNQNIQIIQIQLSQSSYVDMNKDNYPQNTVGRPITICTALIHYYEEEETT